MHRDSSKHGPVLDEQMKHESEGLVRGTGPTHVEEFKEPEALEPTTRGSADHMPGREPGSPPGMTSKEVAWRAEIAQAISAAGFPADRGKLLRHLNDTNARSNIILAMTGLPTGQTFRNTGDVVRALGLHTEEKRV